MRYEKITPSPLLRSIVESFWVQEKPAASSGIAASCVVPTGTVEILFHYGAPLAHEHGTEERIQPMSYVAGPRMRPVRVRATGRVGIVIASLYPWGLSRLFPAALDAVDGYPDLRSFESSSQVAALEERMQTARDVPERVAHVETFLMRHLSGRACDPRSMAAAAALASQNEGISVGQVAERLGISRRHLSRTFISAIGLSPKAFSRIMRFQRAMRMRRVGRESWAAIAATCGFADQAHLIRELRAFAGRTPGACSFDDPSPSRVFNGTGASRFFDTVYVADAPHHARVVHRRDAQAAVPTLSPG